MIGGIGTSPSHVHASRSHGRQVPLPPIKPAPPPRPRLPPPRAAHQRGRHHRDVLIGRSPPPRPRRAAPHRSRRHRGVLLITAPPVNPRREPAVIVGIVT